MANQQVGGAQNKQSSQTRRQDHRESIDDMERLGWMSGAPQSESSAGNFREFVRRVVKRFYWEEYSNTYNVCKSVFSGTARLEVSFIGRLNWESTRSVMVGAVAELPVHEAVKARAQADMGVSSKSSFEVMVGLSVSVEVNVGEVVAHTVARQAGLGHLCVTMRDRYLTADGTGDRFMAMWRDSSGLTHRWWAGNTAPSCPMSQVTDNGIAGTIANVILANGLERYFNYQTLRLNG